VRGWMNPLKLLRFLGFYLRQLTVANLYVAWEIITPQQRLSTGIIAVPMESRTPIEVTLFANLISLTPGTVTIDVDPDAHLLYVHGLHVGDPATFRRDLGYLEGRLLEVLR
jgi:multicomponent Na+:H+ antiporter subunit E